MKYPDLPRLVMRTAIVPTTGPAAELNEWSLSLEQRRRDDIQAAWDSRKEYRALEADANARGVLSYYNINRGSRMPYHDRANDEQFDMADRDIANVELLEFGQVDEALGMMIDAAEAQHEMEELNCRWGLVESVPPQPEVPAFKSATAWERRDVVAFRSKRK